MDSEYILLNEPTVYEILLALKDGSLTDLELRKAVNDEPIEVYLKLGDLIKEGLVETKIEGEVEKLMITPETYKRLTKFVGYLESQDDGSKCLADEIKKDFF